MPRLTRRQALALAATAPVAAALPAAPAVLWVNPRYADAWAAYVRVQEVYWAQINLETARWVKQSLVAACRARDRMLAERPAVQLSTYSTPQENQDRNHIDEACGPKSVQIDPTGY